MADTKYNLFFPRVIIILDLLNLVYVLTFFISFMSLNFVVHIFLVNFDRAVFVPLLDQCFFLLSVFFPLFLLLLMLLFIFLFLSS